MTLYSKRNRAPATHLVYDFEPQVKERILLVFERHCPNFKGGPPHFWNQMGSALMNAYGTLRAPFHEATRVSRNPVEQHFFSCDAEQAADFIELGFQLKPYDGGQAGVDEINDIFREEAIGFEITPWTERKIKQSLVSSRSEIEYPRIVRRETNAVHDAVVNPVFTLLSDVRFAVANHEMIKGFVSLRHGEYEDAITLAGSAFESFMKTICVEKGWYYDPKDTCSKLVKILKDNNAFPPFYAPIFEAVGTIRNNVGDAHGRGPMKTVAVTLANAEHMVHVTASHMLFLAKQAGF